MNYREDWQRDGYLVVRNVFDQQQIARLFEVCEANFEQWKNNSTEAGEPAGYAYGPSAWSLLHLNHSRYYKQNPQDLRVLLDAVANPLALDILRDIFQENPVFMQSNYYIDPPVATLNSAWHRDCQFFAKGDEEKERQDVMAEADPPRELHMHIPLIPTAASELVPGSQNRWDTPEENRIRRQDPRSDDMPGAVSLKLVPGDLAFFHVNTLHRGLYVHGVPRRTIAVTFGRESFVRKATAESLKAWDGYISTYQPWMQDPKYLHGVAETTRQFFERFVNIYKDSWDLDFTSGLNKERQDYFKDY